MIVVAMHFLTMFWKSPREKTMPRLETLQDEIAKLSPEDFAKLREWLLEKDWAEWDRQLEADAAAGKLDKLFESAEADHRAGKSREL